MRGRAELKNVTLGLLGASTPKWLKSSVPIEAFAGGLMSRLLMIVKEDSPRTFPSPPPLDNETWHRLLNWLREVQQFENPVALTSGGTKWFDTWYVDQRKLMRKAGEDNVGYFSRKPDHLLRLALNLQISRGEHHITEVALEESNDIFSWLEDNTPTVIKLLLSTDHGALATTVIQLLKRAGGHAPKRDILRTLTKSFPPRMVMDSIGTMFTTEQLGRYDGGERVGDVYFLKDWGED